MKIGGIIDISTKDIPGKVSTVLFTVGCNFKCFFCHNKQLLDLNIGRDYEINELLSKIKRNSLVNSVSITGGEPTLQADIIEVCEEISKIGKYLSIDTNGSTPQIIKKLLPFINRVAMDIKTPLKKRKLEKLTGINLDSSNIVNSFNIINEFKKVDFEIRTTYIKNYLKPDDINEIISWLIKNKFRGNYVLQQYQYSNGVGEEFKNEFQKPEHKFLINLIKPFRNKDLPFRIYLRDDEVGYLKVL